MTLVYTEVFILAFLLSWVFLFLFRRLAVKYSFICAKDICHLGGLGMWLSFLIVVSIGTCYGYLPAVSWGIILGTGVITGFGIVDDYKKELSVAAKFLIQLGAVVIVMLGGVRTQIVYLGPFLNMLVTVLWMLGITNALNHLDILDGLAGGITAICALAFLAIAVSTANSGAAVFSLVLAGITLPFLRHNLSPGPIKVYMGNSGSHFLGFALAVMAITISYAPVERKIALLSPIFVLGLPLFDTAFLIFRRIKNKRSVFEKSGDHFALRLTAQGYSKDTVLALMYLLGVSFCAAGVLLSHVSNGWGMGILGIVLCGALLIARKVNKGFAGVDYTEKSGRNDLCRDRSTDRRQTRDGKKKI